MEIKELSRMCKTEYAFIKVINILVKNIEPCFIISCIKGEIINLSVEINGYIDNGYIYEAYNSYHVNWKKCSDLAGCNLTEEQEREYDEVFKTCHQATLLLSEYNKLKSILWRFNL